MIPSNHHSLERHLNGSGPGSSSAIISILDETDQEKIRDECIRMVDKTKAEHPSELGPRTLFCMATKSS
jgi:hypothetical protein